MSRTRDEVKKEVRLEMTPMIDVTFLLLVFFLCLIQFKLLEGRLGAYLPNDVGVNTTPSDPLEKVRLSLAVIDEPADSPRRSQSIAYRVGNVVLLDPSSLDRHLRMLRERDPNLDLKLDPEAEVLHEYVVQALDTCVGAGFEKVTIVGSSRVR